MNVYFIKYQITFRYERSGFFELEIKKSGSYPDFLCNVTPIKRELSAFRPGR